jgi:N-acetylmuramoyl-L-alanine amidase
MAKKIMLDAGHYAKYNRSPAVPAYWESEMNWKLHNYLKAELQAYGFIVAQTRADKDKDLSLTARGKASKGCDLFLSIHSNAVGSRVDESVDHPVVFVPLNKSGDKLGRLLGDCIAETMGTKQKAEVRSKRGNNGDWYGVIRGATSVGVPGLILEHSFHTNTRSTKWLMVDSNLKKMAAAEAKVIADYYGVKKPEPTLYRVQVGAYTVKANADKMLAKVKAKGFDAFVTKVGAYYKVQLGAFSVKANADKMLAKVKATGFDAFITK